MNVVEMRVSQLNPAAYNPRKDLQPGEPAYEAIKRSLDAFGLVEPLVWNKRTKNLVGGHQRLKVLVAEGHKTVAVSVVDLPLEQEQALNIALNRIDGAWERDQLHALLASLSPINLKLTGFDVKDLRALAPVSVGAIPAMGEYEYRILIDCESEEVQAEMLARFEAEGLSCRALIS